jgi:hypothetical protein
MSLYIQKLRKAREVVYKIDDTHSVTFVRPSELDVAEYKEQSRLGQRITVRAIIRDCVIAWSGFQELDFDAGGTIEVLKFDIELLIAWLEDRSEIATDIMVAILDSVQAYEKAKAERAGKLEAG